MNEDLFVQRQRIITLLYEAKNILKIELPRIKVRIVDFENEDTTLGKCFINKDYITVSHKLTAWDENYLRLVVWHELAHAYFNAVHEETCPLMSPIARNNISKDQLVKSLLKVKKNNKKTKIKPQNLESVG